MPFRIVRNDITKMQVDAIVNTANEEPIYSSGTDTAVYEAAGAEELLEARRQIGVLAEGEVAITEGFHLPAKYIIHAVSPCYIDGESGEEGKLRSCYERSLQLALEYECKSIAFPLIATGSFGYPKSAGMEIALQVIHNFLMKEEMTVYLVVFDKESVRLSGLLYDEIEAFIDENYVAEKQIAEYGYREADVCEAQVHEDLHEYAPRENVEECMAYRTVERSVSPDDLEDGYDEVVYIDECDYDDDLYEEDYFEDDFEEHDVDDTIQPPLTSRGMEQPAASVPEFLSKQRTEPQPLRSLDDLMANMGETFQQMLLRLIREKGREEVDVYKGAYKDKKLFYKIRNNVNYQPTKHTIYAFALSLQLSLDETKDLLQTAGFAMSKSNQFDVIMMYVFEHKIYDMYKIDCILYDFGVEQYFSCE